MALETAIINTTKAVNLNITNHINNPLTSISNGTVNVSVQTGNNEHLAIATLIVTAILAGGTLWLAWSNHRANQHTRRITIESNNTTKEALSLSKTEYYEKMKPFLVVENFEFREPFEEKSTDEYHSGIYTFVLSAIIRNKGLSSARNIKLRYANTNNLDIKDVIREFQSNYGGEFQATVPSNGTLMLMRTVSTEYGVNLALWFEFDYLKDQKGQCLTILAISKQKLPIVWYDDYDIMEAKKWNEDGLSGKRFAPTDY